MATTNVGISDPQGMIAAAEPLRKNGRLNGAMILDVYNTPSEAAQGGGQQSNPAMTQLMEALGYGDLYKKGWVSDGVEEADGALRGAQKQKPTPELQAVLDKVNAKYQVARVSQGGSKRQFVFVDKTTGQPAFASKTFERDSPWKAPLEGIAFVGGAALGAGWLGGSLGAGAGAGATNAALAESAAQTAGYGASSAGLGGGAGELAAAGAAGSSAGALESSGQIALQSVGSMSQLPAIASNPSWMSQVGNVAGGLSSAQSLGGTTAPGYSASANYGAGLSGAQTGAYDSVINATGSPGLANAASQAAGAAQGVGNTISERWASLTPQQRAQWGGTIGSALAGGFAAASSSGTGKGGAGQQAAGAIQLDVAKQLQGLGTSELAAAPARQAQSDVSFDTLIQRALQSQATNDGRSQQVWDEYLNTYMPAARRMADTAANYDTEGRRDAAGAEAVAGVDAQLARQRDAFGRDIRATGGTLSAGRGATLDLAQRFAGARGGAAADRSARQQVENTGIALTQGVVSQGNQVAGLANSTSALGLQAGNTASGGLQAKQGVYGQALQPGLSALQSANSAAGGAGNTFNGVANQQLAQQQSDAAGYAGLGSLLGNLAGLYYSDPKTKKIGRKVSGKQALKSLSNAEVRHYRYKPGFADGGKHIGRMAGKGDPKGLDGMHRISVQDELGKHHAAISELSKQVKRLSLEDASERKKERA
jgi:hypothetical protein